MAFGTSLRFQVTSSEHTSFECVCVCVCGFFPGGVGWCSDHTGSIHVCSIQSESVCVCVGGGGVKYIVCVCLAFFRVGWGRGVFRPYMFSTCLSNTTCVRESSSYRIWIFGSLS